MTVSCLSKGAAPGIAVAASADASHDSSHAHGTSGTHTCPINAVCKQQNEANLAPSLKTVDIAVVFAGACPPPV